MLTITSALTGILFPTLFRHTNYTMGLICFIVVTEFCYDCLGEESGVVCIEGSHCLGLGMWKSFISGTSV
jgi:hypothetical protein